MPLHEDVTTVGQLLAMPYDGTRHELLDGQHVVTPSPSLQHQLVLAEINAALRACLAGVDELHVLTSPADIVLEPNSLVQPDLFVFRTPADRPPQSWEDISALELAVEILSPATAARDRGVKREIYQRAAVREYWIADPDARLLERWQPPDKRPETLTDTFNWVTSERTETLDVTTFFRSLPSRP